MAEDLRTMGSTAGIPAFETTFETPECLVLDSAYCSMGRMVALRACEKTGWTYHDSVTLLELVPDTGVTPADVEAFERPLASGGFDPDAIRAQGDYLRIRNAFVAAFTRAVEMGPCLIHDRAHKSFVQGLGRPCVSAMTYATDRPAMRVRARFSPLYRELSSDGELDEAIRQEDAMRRAWHALGSDVTRWGEPATYDLMLNTDQLGIDFSAEMLARLMRG